MLMPAAKEQGNDGHIRIFSLFLLQYIILFFLKIASKRSESCSRSNKDNFCPSINICKSRFFELGFKELRLRLKIFWNKTIFNNTSSNNHIFLGFSMWSYSKESGSYRIRQLNKILKCKLYMVLLDYSNKIIPFKFIFFFSDPLKFISSFYRILSKIARIVRLKFS
jgi:hypothetical protein